MSKYVSLKYISEVFYYIILLDIRSESSIEVIFDIFMMYIARYFRKRWEIGIFIFISIFLFTYLSICIYLMIIFCRSFGESRCLRRIEVELIAFTEKEARTLHHEKYPI